MSSPAFINSMRSAGKKLGSIRHQLVQAATPGTSLADLDKLAFRLILDTGAQPAFPLVSGYHHATCINLNSGVVHGIPHSNLHIKPGDLVTIDVGLYYQGVYSDAAHSFVVGAATPAQHRFLRAGATALTQAIAAARPGKRIGHISAAIEQAVTSAGYSPLRTLTGHGVGFKLHQPPAIPCFLDGSLDSTPVIVPGMTLAIEAIFAAGSSATTKLPDGWTIVTRDGQDAAVFEDTVLVTSTGPQVLTTPQLVTTP